MSSIDVSEFRKEHKDRTWADVHALGDANLQNSLQAYRDEQAIIREKSSIEQERKKSGWISKSMDFLKEFGISTVGTTKALGAELTVNPYRFFTGKDELDTVTFAGREFRTPSGSGRAGGDLIAEGRHREGFAVLGEGALDIVSTVYTPLKGAKILKGGGIVNNTLKTAAPGAVYGGAYAATGSLQREDYQKGEVWGEVATGALYGTIAIGALGAGGTVLSNVGQKLFNKTFKKMSSEGDVSMLNRSRLFKEELRKNPDLEKSLTGKQKSPEEYLASRPNLSIIKKNTIARTESGEEISHQLAWDKQNTRGVLTFKPDTTDEEGYLAIGEYLVRNKPSLLQKHADEVIAITGGSQEPDADFAMAVKEVLSNQGARDMAPKLTDEIQALGIKIPGQAITNQSDTIVRSKKLQAQNDGVESVQKDGEATTEVKRRASEGDDAIRDVAGKYDNDPIKITKEIESVVENEAELIRKATTDEIDLGELPIGLLEKARSSVDVESFISASSEIKRSKNIDDAVISYAGIESTVRDYNSRIQQTDTYQNAVGTKAKSSELPEIKNKTGDDVELYDEYSSIIEKARKEQALEIDVIKRETGLPQATILKAVNKLIRNEVKKPEDFYNELKFKDDELKAIFKASREPDISEAKISEAKMNTDVSAKVYTELDVAEAGERLRFVYEDIEDQFSKIVSSFPEWVPDRLRNRKLFDKVQQHMLNNSVPKPRNTREMELYTVVNNRIREGLGLDKVSDTAIKDYSQSLNEARKILDKGKGFFQSQYDELVKAKQFIKDGFTIKEAPKKVEKVEDKKKAVSPEVERVRESVMSENIIITNEPFTYDKKTIIGSNKEALRLLDEDREKLTRIATGHLYDNVVNQQTAAKVLFKYAEEIGDQALKRTILSAQDFQARHAGSVLRFRQDTGFVTPGSEADVVQAIMKAKTVSKGREYIKRNKDGSVNLKDSEAIQKKIQEVTEQLNNSLADNELDINTAQAIINSITC